MATKEKLFEQIIKGVIVAALVSFLLYMGNQSIIVIKAAETINESSDIAKDAKKTADSSVFYSKMLLRRFDVFEQNTNLRINNVENNLILVATKIK